MFRRFHARSVLALLLFGFLLVTAPLVTGLVVSGAQIDRVTRQSEALLAQAVGTTQAARETLDRLIALERAARQYRVLRDLEARASFDRQFDAFQRQLADFRQLELQDSMTEQLNGISTEAAGLADKVRADAGPEEWPATLASGFRELDARVREQVAASEALAERALARLEELGSRTRATSLVQLALIIPFAVVLAIVFTSMINRPIRRLDRGIRALARPNAEAIPRVNAPRDLRALSVRLEWVRRKLARIERDRQRLIGQVSHELKTPLSAIREGISLLDDRVLGELSREHGEIISIMKTNISRLQDQIDALLRYNRMQSGLRPAEFEQVDLDELIEEVVSDHAFAMTARGIEAEVRVEPGLDACGDRDMLRTALDNLFSNALKYSPDGATIGVFAESSGRWAVVQVGDQGPGIRPADRHRLFEPFFRGHGPNRGNVPGSGLGLAICRDLIRIHGGEVDLGERPGWTTVFEVRLPREAAASGTPDQRGNPR